MSQLPLRVRGKAKNEMYGIGWFEKLAQSNANENNKNIFTSRLYNNLRRPNWIGWRPDVEAKMKISFDAHEQEMNLSEEQTETKEMLHASEAALQNFEKKYYSETKLDELFREGQKKDGFQGHSVLQRAKATKSLNQITFHAKRGKRGNFHTSTIRKHLSIFDLLPLLFKMLPFLAGFEFPHGVRYLLPTNINKLGILGTHVRQLVFAHVYSFLFNVLLRLCVILFLSQ